MRERCPTTAELLRLDGIAKKLGVRTRWGHHLFARHVIDAALSRVTKVIRRAGATTGETIAESLANDYGVRFEEVRSSADIDRIEDKYLRQKRELGFGQLRAELTDPKTDALLFERIHAGPSEPDRWVAVLNLQGSESRAFFDRFHELSHRIAEPAQGVLPFRRHQVDAVSPLERLIDQIGGTLAFYPPVFQPMVKQIASSRKLSMEVVASLRESFAPTASLMASMNAVIKHWPSPAMAITAALRGRKSTPASHVALRVTPQARNEEWRRSQLFMIPNMRVPGSSPLWAAFQEERCAEGVETLASWTTSSGKTLPEVRVLTSALRLGDVVYGTLSVLD